MNLLDILGQAGRSARDLAAIKAGLLRQAAAQNAAPMARGFEEGLIGEGVDMARAGVGALGDAYGAGDGALEKLLAGYHDRMAKARARAAALRSQSPEAFEYGEKLPERVADAAGVLGAAGHVRLPELPRIGPGAAPELAFARTGGARDPMQMPEVGPKPISRAGELLELEQRAYHGTHVADMDEFDLEKIGTGEGTQNEGWGGYFAEHPRVGDSYRQDAAARINRAAERTDRATGAKTPEIEGRLYAFEIPDNNVLLDREALWRDQPTHVKRAIAQILRNRDMWAKLYPSLEKGPQPWEVTGKDLYRAVSDGIGGDKAASLALKDVGVPGLRYIDDLEGMGNPTSDFVIWDQSKIGKPAPGPDYVIRMRDTQ